MIQPRHPGTPVILRENPLSANTKEFRGRLERLGFCVALATGKDELCSQLDRHNGPMALLLNTALSAEEIADSLSLAADSMRPSHITPLAVGATPGLAVREALGRGGVTLAALEPLDDATLRFQINRAFLAERQAGRARLENRAPWNVPVTFLSEGRQRRADLYNLSRHGAFLETIRPVQPGAQIEFTLPLPHGPAQIRGEIVHTNSPGYKRRTRAPVGIGVRFEPLPDANQTELDEAVASRCTTLLL
ncbi:MAG: hypothetical protein GY723_23195 [bacterium]|nr:hypothetical protein [bacterium]